ncbi:MAG: protein kinase [Bacteroides sp.]|nr:protein kinase [Bacteroides sp.]MBD5360414.1 protein kinase [Bacteroides sp.]MBD5363555.1 protein kinase [Bacteroides sp.]MDE6032839.1 protein kinase [Muribaculaceae bacterium]MDE6262466.1 protein kinase [Muribaculaceae bacterium]
MTTPQDKWTELELLPEWSEDFYDVYTGKKFGKWVMLKTLKPEYRDNPEYQAMLNREFEVRYNLAHAHIIMINDLEEVPGLGMCIITDDVYGDSLKKLIARGEVTQDIVNKIARCVPDAIEYIQTNHIVHHPIDASSIIFTEKIRNLKLIDVGFDQKNVLEVADTTEDIRNFGHVLIQALDACPEANPRLRTIAEKCIGPSPYRTVQQLQVALHGGSTSRLYVLIITVLALMVAALTAVIVINHP